MSKASEAIREAQDLIECNCTGGCDRSCTHGKLETAKQMVEVVEAIRSFWNTRADDGEAIGHPVALSPYAQLLDGEESISDAIARVSA